MTYQSLWLKSKNELGLDGKTIQYMFKYYLHLTEEDKISNIEINNIQVKHYLDSIEKLKKGYPIQYIVGNIDFYGYNFDVRENVLIPRFETEELVYYTKKYIEKYFPGNIFLIDIGTGSGAIGITLKKELPNIMVTLVDISTYALDLAKTNSKKLNVDTKIYKSDMLDEVIKRQEKYDVIISNPPYLTPDEEIMESVKKYEPKIALYGGNNGLKYYEIILRDAKKVLKDKGLVAFEIGSSQGSELILLAEKYFKGCPYEIKKDLEGRDRMFFLFYNLFD